MEDKRRLGEPRGDRVPDAFRAATTSSRGRAVVTRNTGEFRNSGVEAVSSRTVAPR